MKGSVRGSGQMGRLGMVGVDFKRGEQESLTTRFVTAALGFDSHEYRIDLRQGFWIITFKPSSPIAIAGVLPAWVLQALARMVQKGCR